MTERNMAVIQTAQATVDDLTAKVEAAKVRLADAKAARETAEAAVGAGIEASLGGAKVDPIKLQRAAADAEDMERFTARALDVLLGRLDAAMTARVAAEGESFRPLYDEGRALRAAGCVAGDKARADLAAAEDQFRRGSALIASAFAARCPHPEGVTSDVLARSMGTAADEGAIWEGRA